MKRPFFSLHRLRVSGWIQFISFVLCYSLLAPGLALASIKTGNNALTTQQGWLTSALPTPTPTPTPGDGVRRLTPGPYVPPALRGDNAERRANGKTGKLVDAPPIKQGAPLPDLPDLAESRSAGKSSAGGTLSASYVQGTFETLNDDPEMPCADCNPGGGGGAGGSDPYFGTARSRPANETGDPGVTLGSRNFNWSAPLINLPGRAGLDVSISLFYNSLVWTKQGNAIEYNADHGTPAPGFQLGLPRLQAQFFDTDENANAYLLVTPSGGRIKMKQVGSTDTYESSDGTYTQLTSPNSTPVLRTTDGTQYVFGIQVSAEWRCTKIEDRNGNYISATYDTATGHLLTLTDTLSRVVNFNYDGNNNLDTITQLWGTTPHTWVEFNYATVPMSFNFSGLTAYGATNNVDQTVLSNIVFPEIASYHFDYNSYGQVYQIRHKAPDGHELEHTFYNLNNPGTQTDCPRFTERRDYAQNWNNGNEAVTTYSVTNNATWTNPENQATETGTMVQQTAPDNKTVYKEYSHDSGWDTGLTRLAEFLYDGVKKKWISTAWTQDNVTLTFPQNPRVTEINIYDDGNNRRRTTIDYTQGYSLPTTISQYSGANGQTLLRSAVTVYVTDSAYLDKRIIGLPAEQVAYGATSNIVSRHVYSYDWGDSYFSIQQPSTGYDATNYPSSFIVGRANLVAVRRYNCTNNTTAYDDNQAVWTQRNGYNMAGSTVWTKDASGHTTSISFGDYFSDNNNSRNTLAYPTTITDADDYSSQAQYNYNFGAITLTHVPTRGLAPNITYLDVVRQYDAFGRIEHVTNQTNQAYTRFFYENNANYVHTYQTLIDLNPANELHSWQVFDGAGRVRASASEHPGSAGGYTGQYVIYDNMGRVVEQSNPTEISTQNGWVPAGDDVAGWRVTQQTYDWKGRPKQTTNSDGSTRIIDYGGCGCAGGEITTVQDEHGRQRRYTENTLGRLAKVEEMFWNTGSVYATTNYSFNERDQVTQINQAGQIRSLVYDGHGRLQTRTTPEQGETNYSYNADDTIQVMTDARLVTTTYSYNNRHQVTSLTYNVTGDPTGNTAATATVNLGYDAAGNRTSMTDGLGSASYVYNNLSQMESETRTFNGLNPITLSYEYNLAGELKKITNPWSAQVSYAYDKAGRLQNVTGANYANVPNYATSLTYRAWGAIKGMHLPGGTAGFDLTTAYDDRMRPTSWNVAGVLGYNYHYADYYNERTGRVTFAENIADPTLDRSYEYDLVGRLAISHSGAEARAHVINGQWGTQDGPYSQGYDYDVWGNVTHKYGWGGEVQGGTPGQSSDIYYSYTGNRRNGFGYDAAGNVTNDGTQTFIYDATGQQTYASGTGGSAPVFTDDPLNPPNAAKTEIKLVHLTELRAAVNQLRARAALAAATWTTDPNPQQYVTPVHHNHVQQLRTKLEEALTALHLPIGSYAHSGPNAGDTIYAADFQELRDKIKAAWTALAAAALTQSYDGNGLRVKKTEYGAATWYLRSTVLGGQVIAEVDGSGVWQRGYVYSGSTLMAVQQSNSVYWMHEDPVTKSKRTTDVSGNIVSAIELDPWGADTNRSGYSAFQPKKFTSYERDNNGSDEAMFRRYNRKHSRFDQPDPYDGSYSPTDPQSLNRYAYTQNDPVNFVDPSGLVRECVTAGGVVYCFNTDDAVQIYGRWDDLPSAGGTRLFGGRDMSDDPQNPEVPMTPGQTGAIRDQIAGLLTDKCATFINQLVSSQTGRPYDSKSSLLTDFNSIRDGKGGFFFGGTHYAGDASGTLAGGNGKVRINRDYSTRLGSAAFTALHEIIHVIAGAGDRALAKSVQDLGITVVGYPGYTVPYPTNKKDDLAFSGYWGQALINACTARGY
jgi:RHS repeat-associated protein